jgi:arylsulfatase A-like enzyme
VFLESGGGRAEGAGQSTNPPQVLYQDSYGNIVPASPDALAAGLVPPPVPSQQDSPDAGSTTYVTANYKQPNFLMIMVDQMGVPRWLPGPTLTNINNLIVNHACAFPNFFAAATACTPSRATLLTGLYSQQTCIFNTLENWCEPELLAYTGPLPPDGTGTGFPTIGNVLSQQLPIQNGGGRKSPGYDTVWLGKWHLSATGTGTSTCPGDVPGGVTAGPSAYGFSDQYCIPTKTPTSLYTAGGPPLAYPSPDGSAANEGCGGALLLPTPGDPNLPSHGTTYVYQDYESGPPAYVPPPEPVNAVDLSYLALGDGAVADAFARWLQFGAPTSKPWFCATSFINPHDMSGFPYGYGLAGLQSATLGYFGSGPASIAGYAPPPTPGFGPQPPLPPTDETILPLTTAIGTAPAGPFSQPWNNTDAPSSLPYGPNGSGAYGKPTLQLAYQHNSGNELGTMQNQNAWFTFLNYYFWMQANVDVQVGRVMNALNSSSFASNTIVIFLSDHGDYAGSHWLHGKAFALYDETINVPLYIKIPGQTAITYPYVCSSVDILPFLYTMALGNASWRQNPNDLVGYLYNREAISDFIYSSTPTQKRLSNIQCASPNNNHAGQYQPYILHTTDEGFTPFTDPSSGKSVPSHAIAFRTVDYSIGPTVPYGGGKLGIYSYWNCTLGGASCNGTLILPTRPDACACPTGGLGPQQFEFYNYSQVSASQTLPPNYGETGNQVTISGGVLTGESLTFQNNFNAANVQSELYSFSMPGGGAVPQYISNPTTGAYAVALATYLNYVASQNGQSSQDTTWQK